MKSTVNSGVGAYTYITDCNDINDDEDTEDYDVDEYLQGSAPSLSDNAPQPNSNTDNL